MTSGPEPVDSGVRQGSVLGPLLFILHINDLPNVVTSQVRLIADDCQLYRPIRSLVDQEAFQCDLEALELWASTWGMKFNAKKWYLIRITRTRNHLTHNYSLNNHILQTVNREKYLGITISNDLNWSTHINTITNKCNSKLGFLRHNLSRCTQKLKETAHLSLVRPTLEYVASVWDPQLIKDRTSLEAVQRNAARFVYGDYRRRASPTHNVKDPRMENLEARRRDSRLTLMYNITHNNTTVSAEELGMVVSSYVTSVAHEGWSSYLPHVKVNLNNGIAIKISLLLASDWSTAIKIVMNIDESRFRLPIYPLQVNYIVMNIDESVFCTPIQCKTGIKTQIMELQFKYPGLWLVNANLNNGITTQISLLLACGVVFGVKCLSSRV